MTGEGWFDFVLSDELPSEERPHDRRAVPRLLEDLESQPQSVVDTLLASGWSDL